MEVTQRLDGKCSDLTMKMHFDWQVARGESVKDIQVLGREIEKMDEEMNKLHKEIEQLEKGRWNINAIIPMSEIKTGRF
jgi:hypothetical protein